MHKQAYTMATLIQELADFANGVVKGWASLDDRQWFSISGAFGHLVCRSFVHVYSRTKARRLTLNHLTPSALSSSPAFLVGLAVNAARSWDRRICAKDDRPRFMAAPSGVWPSMLTMFIAAFLHAQQFRHTGRLTLTDKVPAAT
jgi:hypothetical protein